MKLVSGTILQSLLSLQLSAQDTASNPVKFNVSYTCDAGRNFSGGIRNDNVYMGLAYAEICISTDKLWHGGEFYFSGMNTHGGNLSGDLTGDIQVVSNIENGDYTFLMEMNYRHSFSNLTLVAGLQDFCAEFSNSEFSSGLTNSSFGIQSAFPLNFAIPIFPKTALSLTATARINNKFMLKASIWDGNAGSLEDDPHNLDWTISKKEGFLTAEELVYTAASEKLLQIKLGAFYHSGVFASCENDSVAINGNSGFYFIGDKELWKSEVRSIGIFGQLASFPSKANVNTVYLGSGFIFKGIHLKRPEDAVSAGIAFARLFDKSYECDIECNYSLQFGQHFSLQPVIHYIIHPGANRNFDNAFAGFLRFSISFR